MYTDGEVIETQTADCAVFDNAQAVLLSGQMRITLEDYDTGETIPLSEGSMPVISTNISYDTPNGTVSTGPILAMDPDPAIFDNIGGFFGADSFSFWLSSQQLPEGYVIPGNEQSIGYYDGTILPEGCMTVDRYDNGSANVVFRLKHIVIGDVNGDGEFNIADAVSLQKWLLAVPDAELACWKAGDLDGNLKLNVFDLILMKQVVAEQCKDYVEPDVRSTWPSEMMVVKDSIEMYQGPDTSYPVVATIPGTFVKRLHEGSVQDE
ncbi:MAG: dockerin type I repeat-containing protein [Ruminococcus sp.]|nr:dockerin type I repeat-containing protein [Ruminococcus sp.]